MPGYEASNAQARSGVQAYLVIRPVKSAECKPLTIRILATRTHELSHE